MMKNTATSANISVLCDYRIIVGLVAHFVMQITKSIFGVVSHFRHINPDAIEKKGDQDG